MLNHIGWHNKGEGAVIELASRLVNVNEAGQFGFKDVAVVVAVRHWKLLGSLVVNWIAFEVGQFIFDLVYPRE